MTPRDHRVERVDDLSPDGLDRYEEYVEEEKPYWLSLRDPQGEPMQWELYDTPFPRYHAEQARRLEADGGDRLSKPRRQYTEYLSSLAETEDLDTAMTYEEWLEEELAASWNDHGSPYL